MNRLYLKLFSLIMFMSLGAIANGQNINFTYEGTEIIYEAPEGEIKMFEAQYNNYDWSHGTVELKEGTQVIEILYASDDTVYVRNILSKLWLKAQQEGNDILIPTGSIAYFSIGGVVLQYYPPVDFLQAGRYLPEENVVVQEESVPYIILSKNEFGGYSLNMPENVGYIGLYRTLTYNLVLKPSDVEFIVPPKGYEYEDYQVNFMPFYQTFYDTSYSRMENPWAVIPVKVVRTPDAYYIRGLCYFNDTQFWIKGDIVGDKVVFHHGSFVGKNLSGEDVYLNAVTFGKYPTSTLMDNKRRMNGDRCELYITAFNQDVTFDYDPETGNLTNPSLCMDFECKPDYSWKTGLSAEDMTRQLVTGCDFFNKASILRSPKDIEHHPLPPTIDTGFYYHYITASLLDSKGYMMDPFKLFLKVYIDGKPREFNCIQLDSWIKEYSYLYPFGPDYIIHVSEFELPYLTSEFEIIIPKNEGTDIKAELVYIDGENEWSSKNTDLSGSLMIDTDRQYDDDTVYDLTGRPVNPDNLSPGIYIANGKKFIVR